MPKSVIGTDTAKCPERLLCVIADIIDVTRIRIAGNARHGSRADQGRRGFRQVIVEMTVEVEPRVTGR